MLCVVLPAVCQVPSTLLKIMPLAASSLSAAPSSSSLYPQQQQHHHQQMQHNSGHHQQQVPAANDPRLVRLNEATRILTAAAGESQVQEVWAINTLCTLTGDSDMEIVLDEMGPELLDAVADALDRHNDAMLQALRRRLRHHSSSSSSSHDAAVKGEGGQRFSSSPSKNSSGTGGGGGPSSSTSSGGASSLPPWLNPFERRINQQDPGPLVLGLLSILRNLSYIVANEEPLAHHPRIVAHLISLLPCLCHIPTTPHNQSKRSSSSSSSRHISSTKEAGIYVVEILLTLAPKLDVAGIPMDEDDLLAAEGVPEDSLMALVPAKLRMQSAGLPQSRQHQEFVSLIQSLFPILMEMVGEEERHGIMCSMELLSRLLAIEDNAELMARLATPAFLVRLHELFYVPSKGPDSMSLVSGAAAAAAAAAAATGGVEEAGAAQKNDMDTDLRAWSLEIMSLLSGFRVVQRKLLDDVPGLLRSLVLQLPVNAPGGGRAHVAANILLTLVGAMATEVGGESGGGGAVGKQEEMEALKPLLTHYAFRPGGEVAAEVLWSVFVAPSGESPFLQEESMYQEQQEEEEEE